VCVSQHDIVHFPISRHLFFFLDFQRLFAQFPSCPSIMEKTNRWSMSSCLSSSILTLNENRGRLIQTDRLLLWIVNEMRRETTMSSNQKSWPLWWKVGQLSFLIIWELTHYPRWHHAAAAARFILPHILPKAISHTAYLYRVVYYYSSSLLEKLNSDMIISHRDCYQQQ
jgi:hypothetical protein